MVKLNGSGPGTASETESSFQGESEVSSVVSLSTRFAASESGGSDEEMDELRDSNNSCLPEPGKTRLHLRTKEPLSPGRGVGIRSPRDRGKESGASPTTPGSSRRRSVGLVSPLKTEFSPGQRSKGVAGLGWSGSENVNDGEFVSSGLSRQGSIYSLGRVSFTGQLSQLTSMRLPDASTMAKRISSIPTSTEAAKVLSDSAEQIRMWIGKASELLSGLDAEDDVEWAAAGGREGIEEVDKAIQRFERLIQVYIVSIEELQTRPDVSQLSPEELKGSVRQMEGIIVSWQKIKLSLKGVKEQVEIAMEWEELWNTVLGEIAQEMEGLNRLVFEMEEKRHQGTESMLNGRDGIDLNELETIVEEQPGRGKHATSNRFSFPVPFSPSSPIQPPPVDEKTEESSLLALFARMQPMRASLDFLPMRLSVFHCRGNPIFPTACVELEARRDGLEVQWKKLEADAEALRRELGEDRWILVFRNAGRQALKMCDSVARSFGKLRDAVECGEQTVNYLAFSKKVENYEAKKTHYGPAIERVLAIVDRGVLDRLTVNGEILRLQSDMKRRWTALQGDIRDLDIVLGDVDSPESRDKQLRDSVSTVMSSERSIASSLVETPGTSPPSSIVGPSGKSSLQGSRTPTPLINSRTRQPGFTTAGASSGSRPSTSSTRLPSGSSIPKRIPLTRSAISDLRASPSPSPVPYRTPPSTSSYETTPPHSIPQPQDNRPRWKGFTKNENRDFAPLSAFEPSPYAKTQVPKKHPTLSVQRSNTPATSRTPVNRNVTAPPLSRPPSTVPGGRKSSLPVPSPLAGRTVSAAPAAPTSIRRPSSALRTSSAMAQSANGSAHRRNSFLPVRTEGEECGSPSVGVGKGFRPGSSLAARSGGRSVSSGFAGARPPSALAGAETGAGAGFDKGRRSSIVPLSQQRAGSRMDWEEGRPRWR